MKKGQVWIETVIYTLIALVMIGLVLAFAKPKIEELQDKTITEQSLGMLKNIDSIILTMGAAGNQRTPEIQIKKGILKIDGEKEKLIFEIESRHMYSEPNKKIQDGSIEILTTKQTGFYLVTLTIDYHQNYNFQFGGREIAKEISAGSTPYFIQILNKGEVSDHIVMDFSLS